MASVFLVPTLGSGYQSFTNGGVINAAGYIDTFEAGGSTVTAAYTTSLGTVKHANPIVLDSAGRIPAGGEVWSLAGVAMKFVIKDSTSSAIQTLDNIYGLNDPTSINNIGPSGVTVSSTLTMNGAAINEVKGANITIAGAVNLQTATGNYLAFTGTGTVTSISLSQGVYREAVVTNTAAFTNNANILMLSGQSVTAAPGDILGFRGEASPVVRNVLYQKANGFPLSVSSPKTVTQSFTSSATYAPTTGMTFCTVEIVGPGGGGGGTGSGVRNAGGGGGAGGYCRKAFSAASVGTGILVTIGAKGTGGAAGANPGNAGSADSTFGSFLTAGKGSGGAAGSSDATVAGGGGGTATGGDVNVPGSDGGFGVPPSINTVPSVGGKGGDSQLGHGGIGPASVSAAITGNAGTGKGSGGSGAVNPNQVATNAGGDGTDGFCFITEFVQT